MQRYKTLHSDRIISQANFDPDVAGIGVRSILKRIRWHRTDMVVRWSSLSQHLTSSRHCPLSQPALSTTCRDRSASAPSSMAARKCLATGAGEVPVCATYPGPRHSSLCRPTTRDWLCTAHKCLGEIAY